MSRFRNEKNRLLALCLSPTWKSELEQDIADLSRAAQSINPLLALLVRPESRWQAAYGLGLAVPYLAGQNLEKARVLMRRLMWSLNEESGNLGWGVPEAMACIMANSPVLAAEYARIFISYGYETGKDDNFLDYAPLRRGVIWGMGRLAQGNAQAAAPALPHLVASLADADRPIRAFAAWSLGQLGSGAHKLGLPLAAWQAACQALTELLTKEEKLPELTIVYFDGQGLVERAVVLMLTKALERMTFIAATACSHPAT